MFSFYRTADLQATSIFPFHFHFHFHVLDAPALAKVVRNTPKEWNKYGEHFDSSPHVTGASSSSSSSHETDNQSAYSSYCSFI